MRKVLIGADAAAGAEGVPLAVHADGGAADVDGARGQLLLQLQRDRAHVLGAA